MIERGYHLRNTCRLCEGVRLTPVLSLTPTPPANAFISASEINKKQDVYPLDLFFCENCFHIQLLHVINPKILFENYLYVSGTSPVFVNHFKEYADFIINKYPVTSEDAFVIDIGSNDGTFLRQFQKVNYQILGVDPAKSIAERASQEGIPTLVGFFEESICNQIENKYGKASIISANNVFAHIDDLNGVVRNVKKILAPEGIFVFEVSYFVDVYEKTLFDTIYHEHLDYHTVTPLVSFFNKHELELIDVQRVSSHGGSIRCVVQHCNGKWPVDPSLQDALDLELTLQLNVSKTVINYSNRIEELKRQFISMMSVLKSDGKRIAAFGAPAKATTLMYHFDIGAEIIDYVVDDSVLKQNMFTPGKHIPIYSTDRIYKNIPDEVVILAWNFAESIIEKHKQFLQGNRGFIIPLPELRRIGSHVRENATTV